MWAPGKVMRKISNLLEGSIPNNDEYNIRERASTLVQDWGRIINPSSASVENGGAAPAPVAGGDTSMTDADAIAEPEPINGDSTTKADEKVADMEMSAADTAAPLVDTEMAPAQAPQAAS